MPSFGVGISRDEFHPSLEEATPTNPRADLAAGK